MISMIVVHVSIMIAIVIIMIIIIIWSQILISYTHAVSRRSS